MRITFMIALLAFSTIAPVEANTDVVQDCQNYGITVQIAVTHTFNCSGECVNNGIQVKLALTYAGTCNGCKNQGISVFGPGGGCGQSQLPGACLSSTCIPEEEEPCPHCGDRQQHQEPPCKPQPGDIILVCGSDYECYAASNPACWAIRTSCTVIVNETKARPILNARGIDCVTWNEAP